MSNKKGKGRVTLKSYFAAGEIPTEGQFEDLVDSNLNKTDDHITVKPIDSDTPARFIGIGTTDPESPLSISNKTGGSKRIGLADIAGDEAWNISINPEEVKPGFLIQNNADPNAAFLINPNGKIGIGNNDPDHVLSIQSQENDTNISIKNSKTLDQGVLIGTDENQHLSIRNFDKGDIRLGHKSDPNQLTVKENGNIGIGIENPLTPLTVKGQVIRSVSMICDNGPNDPTDIGRINSRTLLFTKHYDDTSIKITYCDNHRVYRASPGATGARWEIRINGASPPDSKPIYQDLYSHTAGIYNVHAASIITGLAKGLNAGEHSIEVWISSPHFDETPDCYTGWNNSSWSIEAEEVWTN